MTAPRIGGGHVPIDPGTGNVWGSNGSGSALASPGAPDPLARGLGYLNWNGNPAGFFSGSVPATQTIYAVPVWLPFGVSVTGVVVTVTTAAVGNKPTGFYVGICSPTTMLQQSADLSGNSGVPFAATGPTTLALASSYTTLATDSPTGLFFVVFLANGVWASTNVQFSRGVSGAGDPGALTGNPPLSATLGTGQTALPSNATAVTTTTGSIGWAVGFY